MSARTPMPWCCANKLLASLLATFLAVDLGGVGLASAGDLEGSGGSLTVVTEPLGATVYVNEQVRGSTPLGVARLTPGDYRIRLKKDGYFENSRLVSVAAGQGRAIHVKLTPDSLARSATTTQVDTESQGGGGSKKGLWIALAVVAVGAGVALAVLGGGNKAPNVSGTTANPTTGLAAATSIQFSVQANDPDGDALTFSWNFGDGTTGSGAQATHVYQSAGTFNVSVSVNDGNASVSANTSVSIRNLNGTWTGNLDGRAGTFFTWNLTQSGTNITGSYSDPVNGNGGAAGNISGDRNVTLRNSIRGFRVGNWTGTISPDLNRISGTTDWFTGGVRSFEIRR